MKKFICIILSFVLLLGSIPVNAFAANEADPYICLNYSDCTETGDIYDVVDDCYVRAEPKNTGKPLAHLNVGMFVSVKEVKFIASRLTRWARIEYSDNSDNVKSAWVFIGNLEKHSHSFSTVMKDGKDNLRVCYSCGHALCQTNGQMITGNINSILEQAILGDFSDENVSILGFVARCIISEHPLADVRDILSDLYYCEPWYIVGMDIVGILPLVSIAKHYAKNSDVLPELVKHGGKLLKSVPEMVDGAYALGKYKLPEKVLNIFLYGNRGLNKAQSGIQGAHNLTAFMDSLKNVNGAVLQKVAHGKVAGVYNIAYTFEKSNGVIATARIAKTVYDPEQLSDMDLLRCMFEAFSNPTKIPGTDNKYIGKALNGLWFEGAIDDATGEITHIFISIEDLGAKYGL